MGLFKKLFKGDENKVPTIVCSGEGFPNLNATYKSRPCRREIPIDASNIVILSDNHSAYGSGKSFDSEDHTYSTLTGGIKKGTNDNASPFCKDVVAIVCPECGTITIIKNATLSAVDAEYARRNNTIESIRANNNIKPE